MRDIIPEETQNESETENLVDKIKQYQREWLDHVEQMLPERLSKQAYFNELTRTRDTCSPKEIRWEHFQ
jgi:hypothetical protein